VTSCNCCSVGGVFDDGIARKDLRQYRRRGPDAATRRLLAALDATPHPPQATLIDIGGGIGVIHHHLLDHGYERAAHVDASEAYLAVARSEAEQRGHGGRVTFHCGDFREVAPGLPPADLVTLHRVVCCDPDYAGLLGAAADHARTALAFTHPKDRWYIRAGFALFNAGRALFRLRFRIHVHSPAAMAAVLERHGLRRRAGDGTWLWAVEIYERSVSG